MKLCKDCKHYHWNYGRVPTCDAPESPVNPVNGVKDTLCASLRSSGVLIGPQCGPDGAWFEEAPAPKETEIRGIQYVPNDPVERRISWWKRVRDTFQ